MCKILSTSKLLRSIYKVGFTSQNMALSKFEYVKKFELDDSCLLNCWPIVRIDGKNFTRFCTCHNFTKPNDERALNLMNHAARDVMSLLKDLVIAYGQSDEYSFVFRKSMNSYNRRASKLSSIIVSQFSSSYVFHWSKYFPDETLKYAPAFDGRVVLYPSVENLRDYLSWRQADCHVNNMYNTCFWSLVKSGITPKEAEIRLKGTVKSDKHEILFTQFGINYNNISQIYRKGTVIVRNKPEKQEDIDKSDFKTNKDSNLLTLHTDIISNGFWETYPHLLGK